MTEVSPNFAGFEEAMSRLRDKFGHDLTFYVPGPDAQWPPGTKLDPETQRPYDPTVEPVSGGDEVTTVVRVSVVVRPMGLSQRGIDPETSRQAIGWIEEGGVVLIVDWAKKGQVENARAFDFAGERYAVRQTDDDYLGPVRRFLIWGKQA